jgi:hypothetical protein
MLVFVLCNCELNFFHLCVILLQAAATTCYVATNAGLKQVNGQYFMDCNIAAPATAKTMDMEMAAWLWKYSEELLVAASTVAAIAARGSGGGHVGSSANGEL